MSEKNEYSQEDFNYYEEFKATVNPRWAACDIGLVYKDNIYTWERISDLKVFSIPKTPLTNGVYTLKIDGKDKNLAFLFKDKDRANNAFQFLKSNILQTKLINDGVDLSSVAISKEDKIKNMKIYQEEFLDELLLEASDVVSPTETLFVALKGAFKEYLFCTDKTVYIHKKGFMTGHTFGNGVFKMPYENITNAEVDYHLASGYFELSSGGLQNKPLNYWSNDNNSPQKTPNAISITGDDKKRQFNEAATFIMNKVYAIKNPSNNVQIQKNQTPAEELRDLKELLDDGIITQEEFDAKKKQLLGI